MMSVVYAGCLLLNHCVVYLAGCPEDILQCQQVMDRQDQLFGAQEKQISPGRKEVLRWNGSFVR